MTTTTECCNAIKPADPWCTGWTPEGHPYHGCSLHPGHRSGRPRGTGQRQEHACKCGHTWTFR